ncbi:MAG: Fic family protein, partial [Rhodanobacter sp.]
KKGATPQATPQVTTQDNSLDGRIISDLATAFQVSTTQVTTQVTMQVAKLLAGAQSPAPRNDLQDRLGLKNREHFRQTLLEPLLAAGWLERTLPDKPTSRLQRYRTTAAGHEWLAKLPAEMRAP